MEADSIILTTMMGPVVVLVLIIGLVGAEGEVIEAETKVVEVAVEEGVVAAQETVAIPADPPVIDHWTIMVPLDMTARVRSEAVVEIVEVLAL